MQAAQAAGVLTAECAAAGGECRDGGSVHPGVVAGGMADTGPVGEPNGGAKWGCPESPRQQSQQQDLRPESVVATRHVPVCQLRYAPS